MIQILFSTAQLPIAVNSSFEYIAPVGLAGEFKMMAFVCSVRAASNWATETLKSAACLASTNTGVPSANRTCSA